MRKLNRHSRNNVSCIEPLTAANARIELRPFVPAGVSKVGYFSRFEGDSFERN